MPADQGANLVVSELAVRVDELDVCDGVGERHHRSGRSISEKRLDGLGCGNSFHRYLHKQAMKHIDDAWSLTYDGL